MAISAKMDSLRSDSIVVFTKALVKGVKSMRPNTQKKIHWVVMELEETQDRPLLAFNRESGVELISTSSNGRTTKIYKKYWMKVLTSVTIAFDYFRKNHKQFP